MVGGTAYVAGRAGAKTGARQAAEPPAPSADAPPTAPPAESPAAATNDEKFAELERLKQMLDSGILTQEEFDAQKSRILASL